jgi:nucleoside-diphosphate-sugar epimerase
VVAATALNIRGYAEIAAGWFGQAVNLETVSWAEFRASTEPQHADTSWEHLMRSQVCSIDKAARLLGYKPQYEPEAAVLESVRWLIEHGELDAQLK